MQKTMLEALNDVIIREGLPQNDTMIDLSTWTTEREDYVNPETNERKERYTITSPEGKKYSIPAGVMRDLKVSWVKNKINKFRVTRTGEKEKTRYTVVPQP